MIGLREFLSLLGFNIRSWGSRPIASSVAVIGFTIVVLVFAGIFSIESGLNATVGATGENDVALVMGTGAKSEMESSLPASDLHIIAEAPGVEQDSRGPLVAAEYLSIVNMPKRSNGAPTNVTVRGVDPGMFRIESQIKIVVGRRFRPGLNEIIVGRRAAQEFKGLQVGSNVRFSQTQWTVVGIFSSDGDMHESEIWTGLNALKNAQHGSSNVSAIYAKLQSANVFESFKAALKHNPQLNVVVLRESQYFAQQAAALSRFISSVGALIALLMGIGAVVGAMNIMYTAIAARIAEIATLRAIGFRPFPAFGAVLAEGTLLGLIGGVIGMFIAYLVFNGHQASTLSGYSQVIFHFSVAPTLLGAGLIFALAMGIIGGLFPAIRTARLPIAAALRET